MGLAQIPYQPMLCSVGEERMLSHFGDNWIAEPKYDGERIIAERRLGVIALWTRRGKNVASKFPEIVEALKVYASMDWILDGELTVEGGFANVLKRNTDDSFKIRLLAKKIPATFEVFDILKLGEMVMVRNLILKERKEILAQFLKPTKGVQVVPYWTNDKIPSLYEIVQSEGGEGVVVKHLDSMYEDGARSAHWIKVKRIVSEDVEVIGATRSDAGLPFASLILAKDGRYFGKVGTGFSDAERVEYLDRLKAFADGVRGIELPADVRAEVLIRCSPIPAEIAFMEVSEAGLPRHPRWVKWRAEE